MLQTVGKITIISHHMHWANCHGPLCLMQLTLLYLGTLDSNAVTINKLHVTPSEFKVLGH